MEKLTVDLRVDDVQPRLAHVVLRSPFADTGGVGDHLADSADVTAADTFGRRRNNVRVMLCANTTVTRTYTLRKKMLLLLAVRNKWRKSNTSLSSRLPRDPVLSPPAILEVLIVAPSAVVHVQVPRFYVRVPEVQVASVSADVDEFGRVTCQQQSVAVAADLGPSHHERAAAGHVQTGREIP